MRCSVGRALGRGSGGGQSEKFFHANPKKALDRLQDGLLATKEVILTGWFEDPDNAGGPVELSNWMKDAKTTTTLSFGRFGIRVDDFTNIVNQTPSSSVGYLLYDAQCFIPPDHPFECNFTLKFWLNGTHP